MRMRVVLVLLGAALLLAACGGRASRQRSGDGDVVVELEATSLAPGATVLEITVRDGSGAAIDDATLNVRGDMNHAGMVPVLVEGVTDGEAGVYRVPFEWTMGGVWIVTIEATLADGETVSEQFNVSLGGEGGGMEMEGEP